MKVIGCAVDDERRAPAFRGQSRRVSKEIGRDIGRDQWAPPLGEDEVENNVAGGVTPPPARPKTNVRVVIGTVNTVSDILHRARSTFSNCDQLVRMRDNELSQQVHEGLGYEVVDRCVHCRKTP
jgi:hypothetical protein